MQDKTTNKTASKLDVRGGRGVSILIHILSTLLGISTTILLVIIVWLDEIERKTKESEDNSDEEADE